MSEHFVKYINIERYKCFSEFSTEGFKRVNLISGKNNVGKTTLMEILILCTRADNISKLFSRLMSFFYARHKRESQGKRFDQELLKQNIFDQSGYLQCKSNLNSFSFDHVGSELGVSYTLRINDKVSIITDNEINISAIVKNNSADQETISIFIPDLGVRQAILIKYFTYIQKKDREPEVYSYIQKLDNTIENVKIIGGNSIQCKVVDSDGDSIYRDINEFGEGLRQYLTIIFAMFRAENNYVFIDELGSGIHYSSLDQLWEIILTLSKELNVQVFATTHSKECIESYCRVAEKLNDKDISFITLVKNKEKAVKAIVRDYEVFTDSIHDEREVRGW